MFAPLRPFAAPVSLTLLRAAALTLALALPAPAFGGESGAASEGPAPGAALNGPDPVRSQVVLRLDREAEFEVSREADGTAVIIHIDRPPSVVAAPLVSADDPLIGSVTLGPDPGGKGTLARVHLRDRTARTVTGTLSHPFRIVLDVLHSHPPEEAAAASGAESPFAFDVPLPAEDGPPLMEPIVSAPDDGPDAETFRDGRAAWAEGELDGAEADFTAFAATAPPGPLAEAAGYYLAELRLRRAYLGSATDRVAVAQAYDALGTRYPRSRNVALGLVRMGEVLLAENRLDEAARLAEVAMGDYADTPFARPARYLRARIALQANHLRTALAQFEAVRQGGVTDFAGVGAAFGLAETLGRMGRYPEAVRFYERGLKYSPGAPKADPRQLQLMGRALTEDGRFEDARRVFMVLYNLYPDRYPPGLALSRLADTFRGEGRWERAEEGYQYVIEHHPHGEGSLAARISLADLYVDRHRAIRAPVIATNLVGNRIDSSNADELVSEALRLYGEVVEQAPSDTLAEEAIFKLALLFEELGDYDETLSRLLGLVTRYPETDWLRPARELGETALARRATELLAAHQPAQAVALYRQYRESLFDKQLSGWQPLYPLALAHEALGLNKEAMRQYLALLGSTAPDAYRIRAVYRLGNLYMERGQPAEALKRYTYFVRRYPGGPLTGTLYLRMAEAHTALGQLQQAAAAYQLYLGRYATPATSRGPRLALAAVYARSGDTARARALYESVLAEDARPAPTDGTTAAAPLDPPTGRVRLDLADLEFAAGRTAEAARDYQAAADAGLTGDDARWARLRAGMSTLALGNAAEARKTLAALASEGGTDLIPAVARELAAAD